MKNFDKEKWDQQEARKELTELEAFKVLIKNNDLACTVEIAGLSFGLCDNSKILPIIEFQEKEIQKFLDGKKNQWV